MKRIVVKVGTSTVCHANGAINLKRLDQFCRVIADLKNESYQVAVVTSGAIGVGTNRLGLAHRPKTISYRQAAAAIGQGELMSVYDRFLSDYGCLSAQILLTKNITEDPAGKENVTATFEALFEQQVVPIVNENDSVATEEIVYGDNDTLSAVVASLIRADLLVILSDIDGLYDKDPTRYDSATLIPRVDDIDALDVSAELSHSEYGTGGMITKLHAAKIAVDHGIDTFLCSGRNPAILYDIVENEAKGTRFSSGGKTS
ncbi:MAG: glutamate 5-kinase [Lachnospiraceae bacterium]|nr:glutamate 5-kinase [Lachnospiraceae bacterium]MBP5254765.1 glutamate 5-kinase [Lachnospiraceae bacterium]